MSELMKGLETLVAAEPAAPHLARDPVTRSNPVPGVEHVLATAGTGVPTRGIILGRDA